MLPTWVTPVAALIGVVVGAVLTTRFARRREYDSWLRTERLKAFLALQECLRPDVVFDDKASAAALLALERVRFVSPGLMLQAHELIAVLRFKAPEYRERLIEGEMMDQVELAAQRARATLDREAMRQLHASTPPWRKMGRAFDVSYQSDLEELDLYEKLLRERAERVDNADVIRPGVRGDSAS